MNTRISTNMRFLLPIALLLVLAPIVMVIILFYFSDTNGIAVTQAEIYAIITAAVVLGVALIAVIFMQLKRLILNPIGADPKVVIDVMQKISGGNLEIDGLQAKPTTLLANVLSMRETLRTSFRQLEDNAARLSLSASVFDHAQDGIFITSADFKIIDVNRSFTKITGYPREAVIHQTPEHLGFGFQDGNYFDKVAVDIALTKQCRGEVWNLHGDGNVYAAWLDVFAVYGDDGEVQNYVGLFSDITEIKKQQKNLEHMAYHDPLTQLPNRTMLSEKLKHALQSIDIDNEYLAICYFDLDGFKPVNDSLGHEAGDTLLVEFSNRVKNSLRQQDTIARLGGDEFALLLTGLNSHEDCAKKLDQLLEIIKAPYMIDNTPVRISASIGYTIYPTDLSEPDTLLRHADHAMYHVKVNGRGFHYQFDAKQSKAETDIAEQRLAISNALPNQELMLMYQPQIDTNIGEVVGVEALLRWNHPDKGLISPAEFLALIEEEDEFNVKIGEWVIDETLKQLYAWHQDGLSLRVSVNISAKHIMQANFATRLKALLDEYPGISPDLLLLEITETAVIEDIELVAANVNKCKQFGVLFALDDFGIGYSSLTYLRRLPVEVIKIDQSFIRDMLQDADDLAVTEGMIRLGESFGLKVIAEGVETQAHTQKLMEMNCHLVQGYGISKPLQAEKVAEWVNTYQPAVGWRNVKTINAG